MIVIAADQLSKFLVYGNQAELIRGFLEINAVKNTGMGFGMMQGQNTIIIFLTLIFIGLVMYYYDRIPKNKTLTIFTAMLLGGAIGNLIDRVFLGFVRDFIDFSFWPAFNIADASITIAGIALIIFMLKKK